MLVLSRKLGEQIHIGDAILTVLKVQGGQVRLGLDVPCEVRILRGELCVNLRLKESVAQAKQLAK